VLNQHLARALEVDRRLLEHLEDARHVRGGGGRVQDAEADRSAAEQSRRGHDRVRGPLHLDDERLVEMRQPFLVVLARRVAAQRDDAEVDRREQLERRRPLDVGGGVTGEVDGSVDRVAERVEPERLHRQPHLDGAARARELEPAIGEVRPRLCGDVAEIVGRDGERALEPVGLANEQGAALDRLEEPLVRVERHRVGPVDARKRAPAALGENGEPAVRGVDVEPHVGLAAQVGELAQRVDGARVGRAGVRAHGERGEPAPAIGVDRGGERRERQPESRVDGKHAHSLGAKPEHACGPRHRRVTLARHVDDEVIAHRTGAPLARARERGEVGRRPTAEEDSRRVGGVADPVGEPSEHGELELRRARRADPPRRVGVERAHDEVAERADPVRIAVACGSRRTIGAGSARSWMIASTARWARARISSAPSVTPPDGNARSDGSPACCRRSAMTRL
jgi:hypothetical protein